MADVTMARRQEVTMHINAVLAGIAVSDINAVVEGHKSFLRFSHVADTDRTTLTLVESPTAER